MNGNAIQFLTQSSGLGASLNTQVTSNVISGYMSGSSIVGANWNGSVIANITSNTLYAMART